MAPRSLRRLNRPRLRLTPTPKPVPVEVLAITVGNRVKDVLKAKHISQAACAQRIAVSARQLTRIITGDMPRLDVALLLEAALETPVHDLFPSTVKTHLIRPS